MPDPQKPNRGAELFAEYLKREKLSHSRAGIRFGVAKSYIGLLVNMRATPGAQTMLRIEELTGGAVPMKAWLSPPAQAD